MKMWTRTMMVTAGAGCGLLLGGCQGTTGGGGTVEVGPAAAGSSGAASLTRVERLSAREEALEILSGFAQGDDPLLRANAIEALQAAPSRAAPIIRAALNDPNPGVRFVAAMSVGRLGLREATPAVRQLRADADANVRMAAIYALNANGVEVNPTPLAELLRSSDPRVRAQAAFVLGELGEPSAVPMLRDVAPEPVTGGPGGRLLVDLQVAEAQYKLGEPGAAHSILSRLYPTRQEELEGAVLAAQIIGAAGMDEGASQLVNLIDYESDQGGPLYPPEMRLAAATALAKLGYRSGGYVADAYLESPDPMLRSQAALLHGELGRPAPLGRLASLMREDPSPVVRLSAAASVLRLVEG